MGVSYGASLCADSSTLRPDILPLALMDKVLRKKQKVIGPYTQTNHALTCLNISYPRPPQNCPLWCILQMDLRPSRQETRWYHHWLDIPTLRNSTLSHPQLAWRRIPTTHSKTTGPVGTAKHGSWCTRQCISSDARWVRILPRHQISTQEMEHSTPQREIPQLWY